MKKESTLLDHLISLYPDSSKATLRSWVEQGRVAVNGWLPAHAQLPLEPDMQIEVGNRIQFLYQGIKVLYEDDQLIAIDKPAGLLSVATATEIQRTAHHVLKRRQKNGRVFPVHRLDRDTSGVMIFAFTEQARDFLKARFEAHEIERQYLAVVEGRLAPKSGTWKSYLREDANFFVKPVAGPQEGAQLAITHFDVLSVQNHLSLVKFKLETGRKNQIRVQAAQAGFPIAGDKKYGLAKKRPRLALHAHKLSIQHPVTGKQMQFTCPPSHTFTKNQWPSI
jgi:23S rRNA pseudouridine1911/1915/1917 synthase